MKKLWLVIIFCLLAVNCYAEIIVFEGTPVAKNSSSVEQSQNEQIEGEDQYNYKLIISKENGDYFWFSREKKILKHNKSGAFHYFTNQDGSGYIKISETDQGKYLYMEHISLGFQTITYWGVGNKLEL